jgi:hypothetical protein
VQGGSRSVVVAIGVDNEVAVGPHQAQSGHETDAEQYFDETHVGPVGQKDQELSLKAQLL